MKYTDPSGHYYYGAVKLSGNYIGSDWIHTGSYSYLKRENAGNHNTKYYWEKVDWYIIQKIYDSEGRLVHFTNGAVVKTEYLYTLNSQSKQNLEQTQTIVSNVGNDDIIAGSGVGSGDFDVGDGTTITNNPWTDNDTKRANANANALEKALGNPNNHPYKNFSDTDIGKIFITGITTAITGAYSVKSFGPQAMAYGFAFGLASGLVVGAASVSGYDISKFTKKDSLNMLLGN